MKLAKIALETPKKNNFSPNLIKRIFSRKFKNGAYLLFGK